jgi:hypothetical protein
MLAPAVRGRGWAFPKYDEACAILDRRKDRLRTMTMMIMMMMTMRTTPEFVCIGCGRNRGKGKRWRG